MRILLVSLLMVGSVGMVFGQGLITVNDYIRDYARLLEIQGAPVKNAITNTENQFEIRTYEEINDDSLGIWSDQLGYYKKREDRGANLYFITPQVDYIFNSKYARSYNDGPLWSGKGSNYSVNLGFRGNWGRLKGVFYPNFYRSQNEFFQLRGGFGREKGGFNYQLARNIDYVQIFGPDPVNEFDFGQSSISLELDHVLVKFGTENSWWGPSVLNPILMSNTAPGFAHLDIGTNGPLRTKFGDIEANTMWGQLLESDFFRLPSNSKRYITGFTFGYRPSFSEHVKGLSLGISRVVFMNWPDSGLPFEDLFMAVRPADRTPEESDLDNVGGETNQYISFTGRWFFEGPQAEVYAEWATNDLRDFVQEADHGSVFTFGLQKVLQDVSATWRLGFEHTSLAAPRAQATEDLADIYTHSDVIHGYTHKGYLLGAPIGVGSKSQLIRVDRFDEKGKYGFSLNRIRFNDNYFWRTFGPTGDFQRHDVEWNFGFEAVRFLKNYEFSGKFIYSRRMNWNYYHNSDVNNFQIITSIKYHLDDKPLITLFGK